MHNKYYIRKHDTIPVSPYVDHHTFWPTPSTPVLYNHHPSDQFHPYPYHQVLCLLRKSSFVWQHLTQDPHQVATSKNIHSLLLFVGNVISVRSTLKHYIL